MNPDPCLSRYAWKIYNGAKKGTQGRAGEWDLSVPLDSERHYNETKKMYQLIEKPIDGGKVCHAGRGVGARMCQAANVSLDEIAKAGRWKGSLNMNIMNAHYLVAESMQAARALAEFPTAPGSYYISCNALQPPTELIDLVYPDITALKNEMNSDDSEIIVDGALRDFIELHDFLARVQLQVVAAHYDDFTGGPGKRPHWLLSYPPYNNTSLASPFVKFKRALGAAMVAGPMEHLQLTGEAAAARGEHQVASAVNDLHSTMEAISRMMARCFANQASVPEGFMLGSPVGLSSISIGGMPSSSFVAAQVASTSPP